MLLKYGLTVALLLHPFLANTQMTSDSRIYGENDRDLVTPLAFTQHDIRSFGYRDVYHFHADEWTDRMEGDDSQWQHQLGG